MTNSQFPVVFETIDEFGSVHTNTFSFENEDHFVAFSSPVHTKTMNTIYREPAKVSECKAHLGAYRSNNQSYDDFAISKQCRILLINMYLSLDPPPVKLKTSGQFISIYFSLFPRNSASEYYHNPLPRCRDSCDETLHPVTRHGLLSSNPWRLRHVNKHPCSYWICLAE